jgi:hypothetical protein
MSVSSFNVDTQFPGQRKTEAFGSAILGKMVDQTGSNPPLRGFF